MALTTPVLVCFALPALRHPFRLVYSATRDCCSILWVANPEETGFFVKMLLRDIRGLRASPYIE